ncbi:MAG: sodium:solute symporter [Verrucomicrobia bacterium]|nr:sodium:solute symporter [Verrucomicrobiota bacterium]MBU1734768.1 sodium:solute symporter [Verrucomicrobiota bacterium]MBU1857787.1 sodium:solute symporter [Verrucomicrobiota bacterium]
MNTLDWSIVAFYLVGMVGLAVWLGRTQRTGSDYFLGGNRIGNWPIAISIMATQCSTNSLLGAPAFVIAVGGLLWLQYELAVPLAMIGVMMFLLPFFRSQNVVSVYEYLGRRFGPGSRMVLSLLFQFLRAFSTGVTVYGISLVIQQLVGLPFWASVLLIGVVAMIYEFLGGIRADIYSDVIQMIILYVGIVVCLIYAVHLTGGWSEILTAFPKEKMRTLDFRSMGFTGANPFAFWPMLFGGFFLYLSYYGCDQTQVQRGLSTRDVDGANMSLFLNGMLRFPLTLTYCLIGVAIGAYIIKHPAFLEHLIDPSTNTVNYNLAVPSFCLHVLPHGMIGLIMVAMFAAAMSSLDSTLNSLSALTIRDVVERFRSAGPLNEREMIRWGRLITVGWGILCMTFSFFVGNISTSIIETINKIGSLVNGPILATFLLATLTRRANDPGVMAGIIAGFIANLMTWLLLPGVSWLWWNVSGCLITFSVGYGASFLFRSPPVPNLEALVYQADAAKQFNYRRNWRVYLWILAGYFFFLILVLKGIEWILKVM